MTRLDKLKQEITAYKTVEDIIKKIDDIVYDCNLCIYKNDCAKYGRLYSCSDGKNKYFAQEVKQ